MTGEGILIVGGGLASQRCIETLRARGYEGRIAMVCAEAELPYDRPPLSKGMLAGDVEESEVGFRPASWYVDQCVELIFRRAVRLDAKCRRVRLDDDSELGYEDLLIATGSAPRVLPQLDRFSNVVNVDIAVTNGVGTLGEVPNDEVSAEAQSATVSGVVRVIHDLQVQSPPTA